MKVLVKTAKMPREEWLRWRTNGIGGSDASVIFGTNPYRSIFHLWMEKTGQSEPEERGTEYTHFGTILESVVKQEFIRRTGLKVRAKRALLQSDEYPFMLADLDGVIYEDGMMNIFEAKTASEYKRDIWEEGVPEEYVLQVQHYMSVTGAKRTYIAALVGGNHFVYHVVERDENLIAEIIQKEKEFWERNVLQGEEPLADGSKATTEYLNVRYGKSGGGTIVLPTEALALCDSYDVLSGQIKALEEEKDAVANQLKNYLKENEVGIIGDRKVTWKQITAKGFDKKRLEKENKEVYEAYLITNSYRKLSVA